jgi:hypothetical protein
MAEQHWAQQSPLVSLLCPPPVNVLITSNTFIKFKHGNSTKVGLGLTVNPLNHTCSIRLFLSWDDNRERVGTRNLPENVSFWPRDNYYPPYYLCDSDVVINDVAVCSITGLVFVFYDTSPKIREILGIRNTYRVTSSVWLSQNVIQHGVTFKSFPSERFPGMLMSCFPSMIFSQVLSVKREL